LGRTFATPFASQATLFSTQSKQNLFQRLDFALSLPDINDL
jgi:hypothetical protein